MKKLLLMRHAKSSWKNVGLPDHQRPLNKRGERDALRMGEYLQGQGIILDAILCSTAVRARATADGMLRKYTFEGEVQYFDDLYHAGPETIVTVLNQLSDDTGSAMIIAHNPGLDEFLELMCDEYEHMTTACVASINFPIEHWIDLRPASRGKLLHFWKPREI